MNTAPPPPPLSVPRAPRQFAGWHIAALLIAVAVVAALATATTGLGLVYYLGQRAPASQPSTAPNSWQQRQQDQRLRDIERQACEAERRAYEAQKSAYEADEAQRRREGRGPDLFADWRLGSGPSC